MFKVEVSGFKTKEQAEAFVHWYTGSGRFDIRELHKHTLHDYPFKKCDIDIATFPFKWEGGTLPMVLNVS